MGSSLVIALFSVVLATDYTPQTIHYAKHYIPALCLCVIRKITELEEELKVVTNNMKSLEIAEQEVCMAIARCRFMRRNNVTQIL